MSNNKDFPFDKDVKEQTLLGLRKTASILEETIKKIEASDENSLAKGVSCGSHGLSGSTAVTIFPDGHSSDPIMPKIKIIISHEDDGKGNILSTIGIIMLSFFDLYRHNNLKKEKKPI